MEKINFKKYIFLVTLYFIANLLTQYFLNDYIELTSTILGAIVFFVFVFIAELLPKKDIKNNIGYLKLFKTMYLEP